MSDKKAPWRGPSRRYEDPTEYYRARQEGTKRVASRNNKRWTIEEAVEVLRRDIDMEEVAFRLHRTYTAINGLRGEWIKRIELHEQRNARMFICQPCLEGRHLSASCSRRCSCVACRTRSGNPRPWKENQ